MTIELNKEIRSEAVASLERYCREHIDEDFGNLAASGLLRFFLEEIAPIVYNQAVADVQARIQMRVSEIDIEVHEEPMTWWRKVDAGPKRRK